jgi:hypothetical protein
MPAATTAQHQVTRNLVRDIICRRYALTLLAWQAQFEPRSKRNRISIDARRDQQTNLFERRLKVIIFERDRRLGVVKIRLLCSLCSLLLCLPQGWCCWLTCPTRGPVSVSSTTSDSTAAVPSCGCCCCVPAGLSGCDAEDGESSPQPFTPSSCPCCFVNALKFVPLGNHLDKQVFIVPGLVNRADISETTHREPLCAERHAAGGPAIFLLLCVWRC